MIVRVEEILESTFSNVQLTGLEKLNFGYGDEKELDAVIIGKTMNNQKAYPLLWYVMPNKLTVNKSYNQVSGAFKFILAHNTDLDWLNDQRFDKVYNVVLFPYLDEILKIFNKSGRIEPSNTCDIINYPNYSKTLKQTEQVDYWDAIEINIDLKINDINNC